MENRKFCLYDSKGLLIDSKDYIPTNWYVLENHYGYSIKINRSNL